MNCYVTMEVWMSFVNPDAWPTYFIHHSGFLCVNQFLDGSHLVLGPATKKFVHSQHPS